MISIHWYTIRRIQSDGGIIRKAKSELNIWTKKKLKICLREQKFQEFDVLLSEPYSNV